MWASVNPSRSSARKLGCQNDALKSPITTVGSSPRAAQLDRTDRGRASRLRSRGSACVRARPAPEPVRRPTSTVTSSVRSVVSPRSPTIAGDLRPDRDAAGARPAPLDPVVEVVRRVALSRRTRWWPAVYSTNTITSRSRTAEVVSDRGDVGLVVRVEQVERGDPQTRGAGGDGRRAGREGDGPAPARGHRCRPPTP